VDQGGLLCSRYESNGTQIDYSPSSKTQ